MGAVREKTLNHAQTMFRQSLSAPAPTTHEKEVEEVICQSDGAMVPIVEILPGKGDGRKRRTVFWKEAISSLAYEKGSKTPVYAATLGGRDEAGFQMKQVAVEAGFGPNTHLHALGDGATWIAEKIEVHFGVQADYLIDFYHLCDYLHQAVQTAPVANKPSYLGRMKAGFKKGNGEKVINWLLPFEEAPAKKNDQAPVRAALRYVHNRPGQFDYHKAIDKELPIGSGEIESTHRHLIQKRLKMSGAWWKISNANFMLHLRTCRANKKWNDYWGSSPTL